MPEEGEECGGENSYRMPTQDDQHIVIPSGERDLRLCLVGDDFDNLVICNKLAFDGLVGRLCFEDII